jgi:hypothetical protein
MPSFWASGRDRVAQHIDDEIRPHVPEHQVQMDESVFECGRELRQHREQVLRQPCDASTTPSRHNYARRRLVPLSRLTAAAKGLAFIPSGTMDLVDEFRR